MLSTIIPCHPDLIVDLDHQLDARWRSFGTLLHVDVYVLDIIERDESKSEDCMLSLVEKWLNHEDGTGDQPRTWDTVIQAVKNSRNSNLAKTLANKHGLKPLSGH